MTWISEKHIALKVSVDGWEEAVRIAGRMLHQCGAVEERYIEAMVETTKELGPYIVIAPGIAIPHARPEDGALEVCFVALQLEPPVEFGNPDNDPVHLVIGFSSPEASAHVQSLATLARAIGREGFLEDASKAKKPEDLISILNVPSLEDE
jgi:mannitol/fructose-specific phosphotransferase system IIA component (Ntr-type)